MKFTPLAISVSLTIILFTIVFLHESQSFEYKAGSCYLVDTENETWEEPTIIKVNMVGKKKILHNYLRKSDQGKEYWGIEHTSSKMLFQFMNLKEIPCPEVKE